MLHLKCPLCGSTFSKKYLSFAECGIYRCGACTNAWTYPPPKAIDYSVRNFHKTALGSHAPVTFASLPTAWKIAIHRQCDLITRHAGQGAKILEIGCGEGLLLEQLAIRGFEVAGIESSSSASAAARARGLSVITGEFGETRLEGTVDVVIMSQVLEHIADPGKMLDSVSRILKDGILLLVQTNYRGLVPLLLRGRWYAWLPSEHFWHFTPKGLLQLAAGRNYELKSCEFTSLVHCGLISRGIDALTRLDRPLKDQFHLLLKHVEIPNHAKCNAPTSG